jgi:hypothetical protein
VRPHAGVLKALVNLRPQPRGTRTELHSAPGLQAVSEVVCGLCGLRQDKARVCRGCKVAFGRYSCLQCSFFDDNLSKECFHCA